MKAIEVRKSLVLVAPILVAPISQPSTVETREQISTADIITFLEPEVIVVSKVKTDERKRKDMHSSKDTLELPGKKISRQQAKKQRRMAKREAKEAGGDTTPENDDVMKSNSGSPIAVEPFNYEGARSSFTDARKGDASGVFVPSGEFSGEKREKSLSTRPNNAAKSMSFVKPK